MLEILQFYVSSFWVWAGITLGLMVVVGFVSTAVRPPARDLRK